MKAVGKLTTSQTEEDLRYGQQVIVAARWVLVLAGLMLAIWNPSELGELRFQFLFILLLAGANFYLHAMLLMGRSFNALVVYGASAADLLVITSMVVLGEGFDSNTFVFYYPAILVFSVAFPRALTYLFAAGAMGMYGLIGLVSIDYSAGELQALVSRLIMMAAVAVIGSQYLTIERDRREAATQARLSLMEEIDRGKRKTQASSAVSK